MHVTQPPKRPVQVVQTAPVQQPRIIVVKQGSSGFNVLMWIIVISLLVVMGIAFLFTGACCFAASASSATLAASAGALSTAASVTT